MANLNVAKTTNNIIPRNNNVLVKMTFQTSIMAVITGKYEGDPNSPADFEIAAIGPFVNDLELGDKIMMELGKYESVPVKGNERSVKRLSALYATLAKSEVSKLSSKRETSMVTIVEYGMFPEFLIKGIVKE